MTFQRRLKITLIVLGVLAAQAVVGIALLSSAPERVQGLCVSCARRCRIVNRLFHVGLTKWHPRVVVVVTKAGAVMATVEVRVVTAMVIEAATMVEAIIMVAVATMTGISAVGAGTINGE